MKEIRPTCLCVWEGGGGEEESGKADQLLIN